jgi:hypothetical protein
VVDFIERALSTSSSFFVWGSTGLQPAGKSAQRFIELGLDFLRQSITIDGVISACSTDFHPLVIDID